MRAPRKNSRAPRAGARPRCPNNLKPLNFAQVGALHFEAPRVDDFPALNLARHAGTIGGTLPAVLNAANEVAVDAFLNGKIAFPGIWQTVERTMGKHETVEHPTLEQIIEADAWARAVALE